LTRPASAAVDRDRGAAHLERHSDQIKVHQYESLGSGHFLGLNNFAMKTLSQVQVSKTSFLRGCST